LKTFISPNNLRSIIFLRERQAITFFQADFGNSNQPVGNGKQPDLSTAMPAPIDGNCLQAEIDRGEMRARRDTGVARNRGIEGPAEPGRVLQHLERIPGIEGNDGLQQRPPNHPYPQYILC
jgi:hypothetical protein